MLVTKNPFLIVVFCLSLPCCGVIFGQELSLLPKTETASKYVSTYAENTQYKIINQINARPVNANSVSLPGDRDEFDDGKALFTIPRTQLSELGQYASEAENKANEKIDEVKKIFYEFYHLDLFKSYFFSCSIFIDDLGNFCWICYQAIYLQTNTVQNVICILYIKIDDKVVAHQKMENY